MKKQIATGSYLVHLKTGERIQNTGGKVEQRLKDMRGSKYPPDIWAWDNEEVPNNHPAVAPKVIEILTAKAAEKDAEIERLKKMLAAKESGVVEHVQEPVIKDAIPEDALANFAKPIKRTRK